ncbi:MAG: YqfO family protein [Candidatus Pacebacteria bacterium]|nr:YqfO family protein [Candidatus Paceibacterota bacterium]
MTSTASWYILVTYVPESHVEDVKDALFAAGAGKLGNYDCCCWQVAGEGQFRPLSGSKPYIGGEGACERVAEYRLELICPAAKIKDAVTALRIAHPYETPAFAYWRVQISG